MDNKDYLKVDMAKINHPSHYQKNGKECIDVMLETFGGVAVFYFCVLNAFKYKWRAGIKANNPKEQDLKKAEWYLKKAEELISVFKEDVEKMI